MVKDGVEKMNSLYGKVVFDEWAILSFSEKREAILTYSGPRRQDFKTNLESDLKVLKMELHRTRHNVGDFDFARQANGTHFDSFVVVGKEIFLLCNSTNLTMQEITRDPKWVNAQVAFAEMTDAFRNDPLQVN